MLGTNGCNGKPELNSYTDPSVLPPDTRVKVLRSSCRYMHLLSCPWYWLGRQRSEFQNLPMKIKRAIVGGQALKLQLGATVRVTACC